VREKIIKTELLAWCSPFVGLSIITAQNSHEGVEGVSLKEDIPFVRRVRCISEVLDRALFLCTNIPT